jgi:acetylxylan esterase
VEETPAPRSRRRLAALLTAAAAGGLALTAVATTPAGAVPAQGSGCAAVSIITARASTEAAGEGITGALVTQVVNASRQTVSRASVSYPASLNNYANSQAQGVSAAKTQLTNLVNSCPNTKVVLLGYSQGANVVGDVLGGGGGGSLGATTAPVADNIASHVAAEVTFGDPRHVTNQAFDLGTSRRNGLFPRTNAQLQKLGTMAAKIQAYCDNNDEFCDSGASLNVHLTYLNRDQNAAANFILGKVGG